jgi:HEAT repeat protein
MPSVRKLFIFAAAALLAFVLYKALVLRAFYLAFLAKRGPEAIPTLIDALDDRGEVVRAVTLSSLARFGAQAVAPLVQALQDHDRDRREGAAITLGLIARQKNAGPAINEAIAPLKKALDDEYGRVRVQAARALWYAEHDPGTVIATLIASSKEKDLETRYSAFMALEDMGRAATDAVPALMEALRDENETVRQWAVSALKEIDPAAARRATLP